MRLLAACLAEPERARDLGGAQWNELLVLARTHGLLARLAAQLEARGLFAAAPYKARTQMRAASIAARSTQTAIRFELDRALRALRGLEVPLILLKGAAYVVAGLHAGRGRFVGDLDVMVPRARIEEIEHRLLAHGWVSAPLEPYDQRYYREWTHELPPLQHPERDTPIDLHHTIAPLTSRVHPDADALVRDAVALADPRLRMLSPADMVLHSALHLFNDEVGMPLRDLVDQDALLREFGGRAGFWDALLARARQHGLERPLYYMLRQARAKLGTPLPAELCQAAERFAPSPLVRRAMDALLARRFAGSPSAAAIFSLRAHWLRMPAGLLVRHLAVKALRRAREP